jgi:hypothetical protein
MRRFTIAAGLLSLMLLVTACAGVPADWTVHDVPGSNTSIALPPDWQTIDMNPYTIEDSILLVSEVHPAYASYLWVQLPNMINQGTGFFGYDSTSETIDNGYATNISLLVEPLSESESLDFYLDSSVEMLTMIWGMHQTIEPETVTLPAGEAGRLQYDVELATPEGDPLDITLVQYLLLRDENAYIFTFASMVDQAESYLDDFSSIMQHIELQ